MANKTAVRALVVFSLAAMLLTGCGKSPDIIKKEQTLSETLSKKYSVSVSVSISENEVDVKFGPDKDGKNKTLEFSRSPENMDVCKVSHTSVQLVPTGKMLLTQPVQITDKVTKGADVYREVPLASDVRKAVEREISLPVPRLQ